MDDTLPLYYSYRIKTWPGGQGSVKGIVFDDIELDNVEHPILITTHYCDDQQQEYCDGEDSHSLTISDVTINNIRGYVLVYNISCFTDLTKTKSQFYALFLFFLLYIYKLIICFIFFTYYVVLLLKRRTLFSTSTVLLTLLVLTFLSRKLILKQAPRQPKTFVSTLKDLVTFLTVNKNQMAKEVHISVPFIL